MKPLTPPQKIKLNIGNILIAEFDGYKKMEDCMRWWIIRPVYQDMTTDDMKYHESWDALMPVWFRLANEIRKMKAPLASSYGVHEQSFFAGIHEQEISISRQALIEAIKWYNKNSPA